ncbi:unnamed protein product [Ectocarpus sp. 4 AP-2014]
MDSLLPREYRPIHRPAASALEGLGTGTGFGAVLRGLELEVATFGGGCFWHVRDDFLAVPGVHEASCGYCGRIEPVRVAFDPVVVPYSDVVRCFFDMHDPSTGDRQGNDWGPQYQAAIFPHDESQKRSADRAIAWAQDVLDKAGGDRDGSGDVGHHRRRDWGGGGGADTPTWRELGQEVRTLVLPTEEDGFTPEASPSE